MAKGRRAANEHGAAAADAARTARRLAEAHVALAEAARRGVAVQNLAPDLDVLHCQARCQRHKDFEDKAKERAIQPLSCI